MIEKKQGIKRNTHLLLNKNTMEKSHKTIQLSGHKSSSVSQRFFANMHRRATLVSGEIKPITKANYNGVTMRNSSVPNNQWVNKNETYIATLDMSVESTKEPELEEYVSTFHLPLNNGINNNNYSNTHILTSCDVGSIKLHSLQPSFKFNSNSHLTSDTSSVEEEDETLGVNRCSCCSEELFMDSNHHTTQVEHCISDHRNENQEMLRPQPMTYLDVKPIKENKALYSFSTKSEWDVRGSPLIDRSSSQTKLDNKTDKCLSRSSHNVAPVTEKGANKSNDNVIHINGRDERLQHKDSDNLYISSRLRHLGQNKGDNANDNVKDQVRINIHTRWPQELVKPDHYNEPLKGVTRTMDSSTGYTDQSKSLGSQNISSVKSSSSRTAFSKMKPSLNIVIPEPSQVTSHQIHDNRKLKARVPEYHSSKFTLDITSNSLSRPKKLTKHLSLQQPSEEDFQVIDTDSGSKRLIHVPLASKVLIPIVLEEPEPQNIVPTESRKNSATDLEELKEMAKKLKLTTRRPSYMLWKERLHHHELSVGETAVDTKDWNNCTAISDVGSIPDRQKPMSSRVDAVNDALAWLKRELVSEFICNWNRLFTDYWYNRASSMGYVYHFRKIINRFLFYMFQNLLVQILSGVKV